MGVSKLTKAIVASLVLLAGSAMAQTSVTGGTQNNIGGNGSQVGAALNTQNYANESNNLSNSNNNSGNTTISGGNASSGGTIMNQAPAPTNTTIRQITAPNISVPHLTSSGLDTCLGSVSGGVSIMGLGVSGGKTVIDTNCQMMKQVKLLAELGLKDAAVARLMQEPQLRDAILVAYPGFSKLLAVEKTEDSNAQEKKE